MFILNNNFWYLFIKTIFYKNVFKELLLQHNNNLRVIFVLKILNLNDCI